MKRKIISIDAFNENGKIDAFCVEEANFDQLMAALTLAGDGVTLTVKVSEQAVNIPSVQK